MADSKLPENIAYDQNRGDVYTQQYLKDNPIAPDDTAVSRLSSVYPAPKPYTPKQEENTRNAASMAETLKSLAEIYGQSKGAYLRQRQPEESTKAENQILYNKNKYDSDLREYGRAMVGAMGQDSERLQQLRHNAQQYGQSMANNELAIAKANRDRIDKLAKEKTDNQFKREGLDIQKNGQKNTQQHYKNQESIDWARVNKEKKDETTVIPVPAHPNDPNAAVNPVTKQRVANIPIKTKDIDAYYTRAMNDETTYKPNPNGKYQKDANGNVLKDKDGDPIENKPIIDHVGFFDRHKGLRSGRQQLGYKYSDKNSIAITQAQDEYNSQFNQATQGKTKQPAFDALAGLPGVKKENNNEVIQSR